PVGGDGVEPTVYRKGVLARLHVPVAEALEITGMDEEAGGDLAVAVQPHGLDGPGGDDAADLLARARVPGDHVGRIVHPVEEEGKQPPAVGGEDGVALPVV